MNHFQADTQGERFLDGEPQSGVIHSKPPSPLTELFQEVEVQHDENFQSTLSQDRSAGASAFEESNALSDTGQLRHKALLPGDLTAETYHIEEDLQGDAQTQRIDLNIRPIDHKFTQTAADDIRAQLGKNRKYLAENLDAGWGRDESFRGDFLDMSENESDSESDRPSLSSETLDHIQDHNVIDDKEGAIKSEPYHEGVRSSKTGQQGSGYPLRAIRPISTESLHIMQSRDHQQDKSAPTATAEGYNSVKSDSLNITGNESSSLPQSPQIPASEPSPTRASNPPWKKYSLSVSAPNSDDGEDRILPQRPLRRPQAAAGVFPPRPMNPASSVRRLTRVEVPEPAAPPDQVTYCIVSQIICSSKTDPYEHHQFLCFEDVPYLKARTKHRGPHLEGRRPIPNFGRHLADRGTAFVIIRRYFCSGENLTIPAVVVDDLPLAHKQGKKHRPRSTPQQIPETRMPEICLEVNARQDIVESLEVHSPVLIEMIQGVADFFPGHLIGEVDGQPAGPLEMMFPYTFIFHHRSKLRDKIEDAHADSPPLIFTLLEYCDMSQGDKYSRADELFEKRNASREFQEFLFRINEPIVHQEKDACSAFIIRGIQYVDWRTITFDLWSWCSDGKELKRKKKVVVMQWPEEDEFHITSLKLYPLRYAEPEKYESLLNQGKAYWNYRYQHKVAYSGWDVFRDQNHYGSRFMIDQTTYHRLHPHGAAFSFSKDSILQYDKYPSEIELDAELTDLDYILCPHIVQGFFLKEKQWVSLYVNRVEPVQWNKEAFERLVLPPRTKELLKALLIHSGSKSSEQRGFWGGKRQDLIAGKGTGLIVLLHGGPGTGKTLTAESLAELAEMPLYSVTCGDIGSEPEAVERYLKRVLYFGKIWNCVLLLDEADVFLEERGLQDLKRNSLVSVFLRTLEYYNGILILTSNRVGAFDEAFKSRIQLALRYPDPDPSFRKKVWMNFFDMLETDEEDVDLNELKEHLDELTDLDMNGREIRNALTTARQLALFKNKTLGWVHLSQAVNAAKDFNKYLMDVRGQTNKDWAREVNLR